MSGMDFLTTPGGGYVDGGVDQRVIEGVGPEVPLVRENGGHSTDPSPEVAKPGRFLTLLQRPIRWARRVESR